MSNYRNELIIKIFNNDDINYVKEKKLDKIKNSFSNKNIDDIIYGITLLYNNDFKEKKLYDLYKLMVFDFCNNNDDINSDNSNIISKLIKKVSILDKGYQLLHIIHSKYNLTGYASTILEYVLKSGTLTNLLFWKKIMVDKYIFTINNLILVVKNSDIRLLKYFVDNISNIPNFSNNINNIIVSQILTSLMIPIYIPLKFKLKRLKILNKVIDFNKYLDVMFNNLPLIVINRIYKYYNFDEYILNMNDMERLYNNKPLLNFYNLTNQTNKNMITILFLIRGYNLNNVIMDNINNIIMDKKINIRKEIIEMFCTFCLDHKSFFNYNSNKFNKNNYKLMTAIMKSQFSNINYRIILKFWDCILEYIYYILPFIKNIRLDLFDNSNKYCRIEKSYNILKRFFNNIYNKRIKYNRMMLMLKSEDIICNTQSVNNIHSNKHSINIILKNINNIKYKYYCFYYEGIITNNIPPDINPKTNIDFNFTDLKCIYLEDESLYLIIIEDLDIVYQHEYLVKNNIKLDINNYDKILQEFIEENKYTSNKWFPLVIFDNIKNINSNNQFIGFNKIEDLYNNKFTIFKNRENIYVKLKVIFSNKTFKLVDYENNSYPKIKDTLEDIDNYCDNNIIKYYPYKKINNYEICSYSIKPNKKEKIDYLLNL